MLWDRLTPLFLSVSTGAALWRKQIGVSLEQTAQLVLVSAETEEEVLVLGRDLLWPVGPHIDRPHKAVLVWDQVLIIES